MLINNIGNVTFCSFCCELLIYRYDQGHTTLTLYFDIPLTFL